MTTYGSVCSGIEAASVAWEPLGWKPLWLSEIEPFPCAALSHHHSGVPNLGDFTRIRNGIADGSVEAPDILVGGTPCFVAGTLVLTSTGYRPVEEILPGDLVVTHLGRLRKVVRTGSKDAPVGLLKAVGLPEPLNVTADHPFLSVDWRSQNTRRGNKYARIEHCTEPTWERAADLPGKQWCTITQYEDLATLPRCSKYGPREAMYLAGMYLGDGHIRKWSGKRKKALVLSLSEEKLGRLSGAVGPEGYFISHERTSTRAVFCDTQMCEWLQEQFGEHSHEKRLPAWVLGNPYRKDLLQGYLDTDGYRLKNGVGASTTSRALAYSLVDLLNADGMVASATLAETPDTCVIEGRTVNQRDWYQVRAVRKDLSRKSRTRHGYLLRTVQSFTPGGVAEVYNIEVEEDNSYVVQGAVVHNCQAFSVAGLRASMGDARGQLTLEFARLADAIDSARIIRGLAPAVVVWENVPGVLNTHDNAFGCFLAGLAGEDDPLEPPGGRWTNSGHVRGPARTIAWRILDAQYFGVAQRRRRVFVVASAGAVDPSAVLFERDGVRRDSPPSREAGKGIAHSVAPCIGASGRGFERAGETRGQDPVIACFGGGNRSAIDVSTTTTAKASPRLDFESETFVVFHHNAQAAQLPTTTTDTSKTAALTCSQGAAVAFAQNSRDEVRLMGGDGAIVGALAADPGMKQTCYVQQALQVRRLTPTEAERLQGFPDSRKITTIHVCKNEEEKREFVLCAELDSPAQSHAQNRLVAVHVLINYEQKVLQIRSLGKLRLSVNIADESVLFLHHIPVADFVRLAALTVTTRGQTTQAGKAGQQQSTKNSLGPRSGSVFVPLCGAEIEEFASDVERFTQETSRCMKSIISEVGQNSQSYEKALTILYCFVAAAISSFIPEKILAQSSYDISIETVMGHTMIPWRGKPAELCPDGPRYKALGNSMAVPVMRWIGQQIDLHLRAKPLAFPPPGA